MIEYVLNNLPSYFPSLFSIPSSVAKRIISLQINFFWGGTTEKHKLATVAWSSLEAPKELRGFRSWICYNEEPRLVAQVVMEIL